MCILASNRKPPSINSVSERDALQTDSKDPGGQTAWQRRALIQSPPVQVGLEKRQLPSDFDGVQSHEVQHLAVPHAPDVPLDGGRRALKGDVVTDPIGLCFLSLDDFSD